MDLGELAVRSGEWLRGSGTDADIVISSRLRVARNLADYQFCNRASDHDKREIDTRLRAAVQKIHTPQQLEHVDVAKLDDVDRQLLMERQLISREHANGSGPRGVAFSASEDISMMFIEEDHLRIQALRSGFAIRECWELVDRIDSAFEEYVQFAFSQEFGYLTACPTNVGTGIRASVMLHLPALSMTKQIDRVFRALQKIQLAVRGLYGEGSQASGDFYQISNNVTLGKSEEEIISDIAVVVPQIVEYERQARQDLINDGKQTLHDKVSRAYGVLQNAQTISSEEAMHLLSSVRMGVNMNLLGDLQIATVNDLFIHSQPAHLQKIHGRTLDTEDRNIARAKYLRQRLHSVRETFGSN